MSYIKFSSKVSKSGNSHIFIIPAYFIRAELVDVKAEYNISLTKKEKKESDLNGRGNSKTN